MRLIQLFICVFAISSNNVKSDEYNGVVTRVIDGDSIIV